MSNFNYTNDILKSLELNSMNGVFFPMPYPDSDSCFRYERKPNGSIIKYVNIVSSSTNKPALIAVALIVMILKASEKSLLLILQMGI